MDKYQIPLIKVTIPYNKYRIPYQDVLTIMEDYSNILKTYYNYREEYSKNEVDRINFVKETVDELSILYELIKKQDSVSVEILNGIDHLGICPVCDSYVQYGDNYCHNCGQRLEWKEVQKDEEI